MRAEHPGISDAGVDDCVRRLKLCIETVDRIARRQARKKRGERWLASMIVPRWHDLLFCRREELANELLAHLGSSNVLIRAQVCLRGRKEGLDKNTRSTERGLSSACSSAQMRDPLTGTRTCLTQAIAWVSCVYRRFHMDAIEHRLHSLWRESRIHGNTTSR